MIRSARQLFLLLAWSFVSVSAGCVSRPPSEPAPVAGPVVRSARLVFAGDVMSHAPQVAAARVAGMAGAAGAAAGMAGVAGVAGGSAAYDYSEVFRHVRPVFERADVAVANLETTLRTAPPYTGYPTFAAPAELAFALREAGVDIVTTANNHICDKGAAGIRSTLAILDSAGIRHTGAFLDSADRRARNPLRFTAGGLRFALLAYTYGTNGLPVPRGMMVNLIDTAVVARDLDEVRARAGGSGGGGGGGGADSIDCVIVSYHWGEEYRTRPTRAQRELAAWTRARGADIIIGGHPHVVEPVEAHYGADSTEVVGATYYSLGNFVSNQRGRRTDGGIVADIAVTRADSLPVSYGFGWRLAWVHTPLRDGVRRYEVLPAAALDTLPEPARAAALQFARDTRLILSADTLFTELQ